MENVEKIPVVIILHAYQPITQDKEILERIINNCYSPFFRKLIENEDVKITLNISGCLLEKLSIEYPEIIRLVEQGILNNQIELMGSAFYHPILPLISDEDMQYQIQKQTNTISGLFNLKPKIFFPPELAISHNVVEQAEKNNFDIIISPSNSNNLTYGGIYEIDEEKNIFILKRDKEISNKIAFDEFKRDITQTVGAIRKEYSQFNLPIVLAMDLETFGEHHGDYYNFFFNLTKNLQSMFVSSMVEDYNISTKVNLFTPSSWSTSNQDLKDKIYYPLWDHPLNGVHQLQQTHIQLLEEVKKQIPAGDWLDDYHAAHYSCQFWWATEIWWAPELIQTGLIFQRMTLENMCKSLPESTKQMIFNLSENILQRIDQLLTNKRLNK